MILTSTTNFSDRSAEEIEYTKPYLNRFPSLENFLAINVATLAQCLIPIGTVTSGNGGKDSRPPPLQIWPFSLQVPTDIALNTSSFNNPFVMPPIRLFKDAPLHPQRASQSSEDPQPETQEHLPPPTRTTDPASFNAPEPTGPPSPQPGLRPVPASTSNNAPSSLSPPAPKPGPHPASSPPPSVTATHTTTETIQTSSPSQFAIPSPPSNLAPTHSTAGATNPLMPRTDPPLPQTSPTERQILEHPPGYMQNPYAADGTSEQRARWEGQGTGLAGEEGEGAMGQAKAWLTGAGEGLKRAEERVWKLVNSAGK